MAAGFGGGYVTAKSQQPTMSGFRGECLVAEGGVGAGMNRMMSGGFASGEIISKDANSMTIKLQNGSTKLVLIGGSAQILTTATTTSDVLLVGTPVTVTGTSNTDGSITAQSIQLRPAGMNFERPTTTRQ